MAKLKDYLASDLGTFLNTDEFAETHIIDGVEMLAIIDSDILKERGKYEKAEVDGVYFGSIMLYVKLSDFGTLPVVDQHIEVDGELYYVVESNENEGLLEITLGANKA